MARAPQTVQNHPLQPLAHRPATLAAARRHVRRPAGVVGLAPLGARTGRAGLSLATPATSAAAALSWSARRPSAPGASSAGASLRAAYESHDAQVNRLGATYSALSVASGNLAEERGRVEAWLQEAEGAAAGASPAPFRPNAALGIGGAEPLADAAAGERYLQAVYQRQQALEKRLNLAKEAWEAAQRRLSELVAMWGKLLKAMHDTAMSIINNLR